MYSGQVVVTSKLKFGQPYGFGEVEYKSEIFFVKRSTISSPTGRELISTISLAEVVSYEDLESISRQIHAIALRRLEAGGNLSDDEPTVELRNVQWPGFDPNAGVARPKGVTAQASVGFVTCVMSTSPHEIRAILEAPSSVKDIWLEMLHLARTAQNPVVEFLGCYQVVAAVFEDPAQKVIDAFFQEFDKDMPPPSLKPNSSQTETVYTRLRNELVHIRKRPDVPDRPKSLLGVRAEVERFLPGIRRLASIAIERHG